MNTLKNRARCDCLDVDCVHVLLFFVCFNCLCVCFYVLYNLYYAAIMVNKDIYCLVTSVTDKHFEDLSLQHDNSKGKESFQH